jgi:TM2 domain-containing membrane protein YozV
VNVVVQNHLGPGQGQGPYWPPSAVRIANRERILAAVLAFVLGGWGVHRFYLGKHVSGVFYLLFCWTFIPSLLGFIEGVSLLLMSEQEFQFRYNTRLLGPG